MKVEDGLFLDGVKVAEVNFSLTFQGNDLTKPDARTASFSNTFTLPDTLAIRDLLAGAEQLDAGGVHPYRQLPARVVEQGETTFVGFAEFVSFQAGWKVNLLDSIISFFDSLKDKPLTDLDLSALDHPWTLQHINELAGSSDGVVYPLIDYGGISEGIVPYDTMCPATYVKTLFGQICKEAGYKPEGAWLKDPLFERAALPFVGADPKSHDEQWVADRSARVTGNGTTNSIILKNGSPINVVLPLSQDNLPLDGYTQGKLKPYKTDRFSYVCPSSMRVFATAQVQFVSLVKFGAAEISFILERNGQEVAKVDYSKGGYYDGLDVPETLVLDEAIDCLKGDELRIRLTGSSRTKFSDYSYYFSLATDDTWASFVPDSSVHLGDSWPVAINQPADITCSDLVMSIAKAMCGTFVVDDQKKTITLVPLDNVVATIPTALDLSTCIDESEEPELLVQLDGYGQKNWCKWKENDEKADVGYGDGFILSGQPIKPAEVTLFELPFMACIQSGATLGGYGLPILVKTRTISKSGEATTINKQDATARIILIEPTKVAQVATKTLSTSGTLQDVSVTLTACWWGIRPDGAKTDENAFSLAFSPVPGCKEQTMIPRYFSALTRVLRRPRMFTANLYLEPWQVATLDLSVAIRLQKVRVGSLEINDNYFYLNKLGPYMAGAVCPVSLIAL